VERAPIFVHTWRVETNGCLVPVDADRRRLAAALAQRFGALDELHLSVWPLRGGLVSPSVRRVRARYSKPCGRKGTLSMVVKALEGTERREADVYHYLRTVAGPPFWPETWVARHEEEPSLLCLEAIRPVRRWPWQRLELAARVLTDVAALHVRPLSASVRGLVEWDYERHLEASAAETLHAASRVLRQPPAAHLRSSLAALRRIVAELRDIRQTLLGLLSLPVTLIHGDLHTGNVMIRRRGGREEPVLIDWARARIGSPLEDVASWVLSLGSWLPEARRRHDALLAGYLADRGLGRRITGEVRTAYWYAAVSNALAGALLYHLRVIDDVKGRKPAERMTSLRAAADWLRVVRRADARRGMRPGSAEVPAVVEHHQA
jgi:hypothetical protein